MADIPPALTVASAVIALFVLSRFLRRPQPLIHGPPRDSFIAGNLGQLFAPADGMVYHEKFTKEYGNAFEVYGLLGVSARSLVITVFCSLIRWRYRRSSSSSPTHMPSPPCSITPMYSMRQSVSLFCVAYSERLTFSNPQCISRRRAYHLWHWSLRYHWYAPPYRVLLQMILNRC